MKLKQLEALLEDVVQFQNPKAELEQYPTGPHIASRLLYTAESSFGDVTDKVVADLGCGCGTLGLAASLLGAEHVIGLDIDPQSLELASQNAEELENEQCESLMGGYRFCAVRYQEYGMADQIVDTVVMNPPFGTRRKGADLQFLSAALKVASQAVYSLHKSTTREHVRRAAMRDFNANSAEVLCQLYFDLPKMYEFHKKNEVNIAVDLWRFVPGRSEGKSI